MVPFESKFNSRSYVKKSKPKAKTFDFELPFTRFVTDPKTSLKFFQIVHEVAAAKTEYFKPHFLQSL